MCLYYPFRGFLVYNDGKQICNLVKPKLKPPMIFNSGPFNSKHVRPKNVIHHEFNKEKNVVYIKRT